MPAFPQGYMHRPQMENGHPWDADTEVLIYGYPQGSIGEAYLDNIQT